MPHMDRGELPSGAESDCERNMRPPHSAYTTPPAAANAVTAERRGLFFSNASRVKTLDILLQR